MSLKDFEVLKLLGQGSYASVYKVRRLQDAAIYALKKVKMCALSEKEQNNALNEIRLLASISHQNIISYKDAFFDKDSSTLCLVTEYADDGDLEQRINRIKDTGDDFQDETIWKVFTQIAKGLKVLHDAKIVHRDLKSANIFLFKNGTFKLGDMNVSKVISSHLCLTQTGTPYYASPEVWKDLPYDQKSDVWSLGCIIYEMCTLHPPFMASSISCQGDLPETHKAALTEHQKCNPLDAAGKQQVSANHQYSKFKLETLLASQVVIARNSIQNEESEENINLLDSIRLPEKIDQLHYYLPRSRYGDARNSKKLNIRVKQSELPFLKIRNRSQKILHSQDITYAKLPKIASVKSFNSIHSK